jgi:hypothetical protein
LKQVPVEFFLTAFGRPGFSAILRTSVAISPCGTGFSTTAPGSGDAGSDLALGRVERIAQPDFAVVHAHRSGCA